jgi:DNA-binding NtrC family response regulator
MRQGNPFDIVILDLTIRDGMGGLDTLQALLKIDPAVVAVVMSGYSDDPAVLDPARYGFKGSLVKPFGGNDLQSSISRTLKAVPAA